MAYPFRNLIFEGGGVKGIAYVGALEVLDERKIVPDIVRVGGTSAGAINAVLFACGFTNAETQRILARLDFNNFMDSSWGIVRDSHRLVEKYGWYKGDFFQEWIGGLLEEKLGNPHATFLDLHKKTGKELYLYGTNISTKFGEVFSIEHTPRARIADAARVSMSIPLFFAAVQNFRGDVYVDGGVLDNYPLHLFDREKYILGPAKNARKTEYYEAQNKQLAKVQPKSSPYVYNRETLGFRLDTKEEISLFRDGAEPPHQKIDDFFDYAVALIRTVIDAQSNQHLHSDDWHRTVYIDTLGVGTTDFGLSNKKKQDLRKSGVDGTEAYFKWYDDLAKDPAINHPDAPA